MGIGVFLFIGTILNRFGLHLACSLEEPHIVFFRTRLSWFYFRTQKHIWSMLFIHMCNTMAVLDA